MTVQATEPLYSDVYVSSGVELDFPFPFSAFRDSDVGVAIRAPGADNWTPLDYGADYTVSRNPAPVIGGTVHLPAPLAAGSQLIAYANIEFSQDRKFENQSGLFLFEIEASLDKLTAMAKLLADDAARSPKTNRFTGGRGLIMPEPSPGRALIGRPDGAGWTDGPTGPEIANAETYANEAKSARDKARQWADDPEDSPVEPGLFSARHHAAKARADAIQTADDRVQTGLDKSATAADRVQTGLDKYATAADRVQTGLDAQATAADRVQTGLDKSATAADRVQTGLDAQATAADRVQTGLDRSAAASSASAAALSASMANGMPLGTIAHFAASVPPDGWLVCDGTAVTALYPDLRAFLIDAGSPYGTSGGNPRLPDLRGEFVRGWDGGRGVDAGRVFGSAQGDAIRNITGKFDAGGRTGPKSAADFDGAFSKVGSPATSSNGNASNDSRAIDFDASRVVPTADENRPRNVALLPCIRAYPTEDRSKIRGEGQEWRNLIRARTAGEEYENTTGRTIRVNLTGKSTAAEGRAVEARQGAGAWVPVGYLPGSAAPVDGSASFTVPAAGGYRVNGPAIIRYWSELRTLIDPATLFANGEQGAWFDPSDLGSMFQDAAGTIPAAYGQPVGLFLDKSGNGNHASQATATARPTLMQDGEGRAYLHFDGVDDVLTKPWTLGWAAPAEVHWLGQSNGTSGAGTVGIGIQYQQTATRFGTLVASNWIFGAPTASGRDSLTTSDGNMSAVAVRGGSATDDLMVAYRDGIMSWNKVPSVLGTSQSGTLMVGNAGYQTVFYGGVMIFREMTPAERAQLVDYFYGAST